VPNNCPRLRHMSMRPSDDAYESNDACQQRSNLFRLLRRPQLRAFGQHVGVLHLPHGTMRGRIAIEGDRMGRMTLMSDRFLEERLGCGHIAPVARPEVHRVPGFAHCSIQVHHWRSPSSRKERPYIHGLRPHRTVRALALSHPFVLPSAYVTTSASWMRNISWLNGTMTSETSESGTSRPAGFRAYAVS
jgi:hypothetical protein